MLLTHVSWSGHSLCLTQRPDQILLVRLMTYVHVFVFLFYFTAQKANKTINPSESSIVRLRDTIIFYLISTRAYRICDRREQGGLWPGDLQFVLCVWSFQLSNVLHQSAYNQPWNTICIKWNTSKVVTIATAVGADKRWGGPPLLHRPALCHFLSCLHETQNTR